MPGFFTILFAALGTVLAARDPRRLLPGVLLTLAAASLVASVLGFILEVGAVLATLTGLGGDVAGALLILVVPLLAGIGLGARSWPTGS